MPLKGRVSICSQNEDREYVDGGLTVGQTSVVLVVVLEAVSTT